MDPLTDLAIRLDPSLILDEMGFGEPDPWQRDVLRSSSDRMLILAHRQAGKSTTVSGLAITTALFEDDSLTLIVSRSQRQANELFRKIVRAYRSLGSPIPATEENAVTLGLSNGSRIISLPSSPDTFVGFSSPRLVIVDEAARTSDDVLTALLPMFAARPGRFVALTTPRGMANWFATAWHDDAAPWERVRFPVGDNPRILAEFLAEQRILLGPRGYSQEFDLMFLEGEGQVFTEESIANAFANDLEPLFGVVV